jgi:hypothetical protein
MATCNALDAAIEDVHIALGLRIAEPSPPSAGEGPFLALELLELYGDGSGQIAHMHGLDNCMDVCTSCYGSIMRKHSIAVLIIESLGSIICGRIKPDIGE